MIRAQHLPQGGGPTTPERTGTRETLNTVTMSKRTVQHPASCARLDEIVVLQFSWFLENPPASLPTVYGAETASPAIPRTPEKGAAATPKGSGCSPRAYRAFGKSVQSNSHSAG
eukprot:gene7811-biopygen21083